MVLDDAPRFLVLHPERGHASYATPLRIERQPARLVSLPHRRCRASAFLLNRFSLARQRAVVVQPCRNLLHRPLARTWFHKEQPLVLAYEPCFTDLPPAATFAFAPKKHGVGRMRSKPTLPNSVAQHRFAELSAHVPPPLRPFPAGTRLSPGSRLRHEGIALRELHANARGEDHLGMRGRVQPARARAVCRKPRAGPPGGPGARQASAETPGSANDGRGASTNRQQGRPPALYRRT